MAGEEKLAARGTIASVVATAAVTLAIGVTAAALGGYLVPARNRSKAEPVPVQNSPGAEARPATRLNGASVVLVPVAPDLPREPAPVPARSAPELVFAAYDPTDHDDEAFDHHHRTHHERHHEDEHDGDD